MISVGVLVDRFTQIPMLSVSIVLWSIASLVEALWHSYEQLLVSRPALAR